MKGRELTLELDAATADAVRHLAEALGVSAQEAVLRAVQAANVGTREADAQVKLQAFDALCRSLDLNDEKAAKWKATVREARR